MFSVSHIVNVVLKQQSNIWFTIKQSLSKISKKTKMTLCGVRCGRLRCLLNDQLIGSIKLAFFWKYKTNEQLSLLLFTLTLETSDKIKLLHPQKLHKIVLHPSEILRRKTKTPGKFYIIFFDHPWKFHVAFNEHLETPLAISSIPLEISYPLHPPFHTPPVFIFSGIAHY